jgi:hypothetical protein
MTAAQIISEIVALPPTGRAEVIRFARSLEAERLLSGTELTVLAERLCKTDNSSQSSALRDEIERGFYGKKPNA